MYWTLTTGDDFGNDNHIEITIKEEMNLAGEIEYRLSYSSFTLFPMGALGEKIRNTKSTNKAEVLMALEAIGQYIVREWEQPVSIALHIGDVALVK